MKLKQSAVLFLFVVLLLQTGVVFAEDATVTPTTKPTGVLRELKHDIKDLRQNKQEVKKDLRKLPEDLKEQLKKRFERVIHGKITAISGTTLTVDRDGKTHTVLTDSNTKYRRHFWGASSFAELSVGDTVNVFGKFTDDSHTTIQASLIRDLSITKRFGAFIGKVTAKNSDNFVIESKNRGTQTVYFDTSTKFVKRNEVAMTFADIQVGHRVRVKGLWDKSLKKITEVTQVKDFSLPSRPTTGPGTPTVTPAPVETEIPTEAPPTPTP